MNISAMVQQDASGFLSAAEAKATKPSKVRVRFNTIRLAGGGTRGVFSIHNQIIRQARLNPGDRLNVLYNPQTGIGILTLVGENEKGWMLTSMPKSENYVSFKLMTSILPRVDVPVYLEWETQPGKIYFKYPVEKDEEGE